MNSLEDKIRDLKREKDALILAHNYQLPEVQDIADYSGDSLELARKCLDVRSETILFCGVYFMAETAAILNPNKTILIPDETAGCPMADMLTAEQLRTFKTEHPGSKTVCYVNSTAEVKAESDICCTSSNAMEVVDSLGRDCEVLFVPDKHLGSYVAEKLDRKITLWNGFCPTHVRISEHAVRIARDKYPGALLLAHPECPRYIRDLADAVLSTGQMCQFVLQSDAREFIIATEYGMIHRLAKENPDKKFHRVSERAVCPDMKKISLEKVLHSLESDQYVVDLPASVGDRARNAIEAMLALK